MSQRSFGMPFFAPIPHNDSRLLFKEVSSNLAIVEIVAVTLVSIKGSDMDTEVADNRTAVQAVNFAPSAVTCRHGEH
ncbi:hypothetical protein [Pyruvatibacter sp.]